MLSKYIYVGGPLHDHLIMIKRQNNYTTYGDGRNAWQDERLFKLMLLINDWTLKSAERTHCGPSFHSVKYSILMAQTEDKFIATINYHQFTF